MVANFKYINVYKKKLYKEKDIKKYIVKFVLKFRFLKLKIKFHEKKKLQKFYENYRYCLKCFKLFVI